MDLDLAQVRAFVAVVDHGHFGRAAGSLSLTQQALSKRIARLEGALGPLLERRPGGAVPTAAGQRLLPSARALLELADLAVDEVRATPAPPLRVDVWSEVQTPARALRELARGGDPPLELSMRRDLGAAVQALRRHELDLAFGDLGGLGQPLAQGLQSELVATDTLALLVNATHPFAERDHVRPEELDRIWLPGAGSSRELRAFAQRFAQAAGIELDTDGVNLGLGAVVARVAAEPELVCAIVADWPVSHDAGVRVVAMRPAPQFPWHAVWRTDSPHPSLRRVLDALRDPR